MQANVEEVITPYIRYSIVIIRIKQFNLQYGEYIIMRTWRVD